LDDLAELKVLASDVRFGFERQTMRSAAGLGELVQRRMHDRQAKALEGTGQSRRKTAVDRRPQGIAGTISCPLQARLNDWERVLG
jgi:hypothetical protein